MGGSFIPNLSATRGRNKNGDFFLKVGGNGSILQGVSFDAIDISYPTSTTEVFEYYQGGLGGTLNATVTITYATASKNDITSVVLT